MSNRMPEFSTISCHRFVTTQAIFSKISNNLHSKLAQNRTFPKKLLPKSDWTKPLRGSFALVLFVMRQLWYCLLSQAFLPYASSEVPRRWVPKMTLSNEGARQWKNWDSVWLRVAEAVNLRLEDIDSKRMVLWVRNGKGHKDRSVALPVQTLAQLRAYWSGHRPTTWFFPSREGTSAIKTSGVQHCLKKTLQQSPIRKKVTCHTLRHSYATHLLEAGVHLRAIQSLMGHKNITTTFIYMHLTQGTMVDVQTKINKLMRRDWQVVEAPWSK